MPSKPAAFSPTWKGTYKPKEAKSKEAASWSHLYGTRWQRSRLIYLQSNPLCVMCLQDGKHKPAEVVDHIIPHKGDVKLFWDVSNWQPLCKRHHDSDKQRMEKAMAGRGGFKVE